MDKTQAKEVVTNAALAYLESQVAQDARHEDLKAAIKRAKTEGKLTQQEIADATVVQVEEEGLSLSRQRISQIINE